MKRYFVLILALMLLPLSAGAWTLPVPSGLTAGDQIYAYDTSTLSNRGSLVSTCTAETWTAGVISTRAGISCTVVTIGGGVTMTSLSETGAVAGQIFTVINSSNQNLVVNESAGVNEQAGNVTLAQYDSMSWIYTGTYWVQIGASDN
jgi:hypothetical protein